MGRITIFALASCPHCKAAKALFANKGWEYYEISLSDYPEKRSDMLALCDRLTVPQIFFHETHLGGAAEVKALDASGRLEKAYAGMMNVGDPTDARLQRPDYEPKPEVLASKRTEEAICIGANDCIEYVQLTSLLKERLDIHDKSGILKTHRRVFTGSNCASFLMKEFGLRSREEVLQVCESLMASRIFSRVDNKTATVFDDKNEALYRLQLDDAPLVLNSFRTWTDRVDPPLVAIKGMKKKMSTVVSKHTDANGMTDFVAVSGDSDWNAFREATCELQKIDLMTMEENTKIAFVINLYNMAVIFAFAELGIPATNWMRLSFFDDVQINVGGHNFSFNQLESGLLRANRYAPYHISKPFASDDPRLAAALKQPEIRIHFALNCGAKSCPPVKNFTEEAIQEELRVVASAFCEMSDNVSFEEAANGTSTLWLSKIFEWYKADFNGGGIETAKVVVQWLRGETRDKLQTAIDTGKLKVRSKAYDWSTNASNSYKYNGEDPKAPEVAGEYSVKVALAQKTCCAIS